MTVTDASTDLGQPGEVEPTFDPFPWLPSVDYRCRCSCPEGAHGGERFRGRCRTEGCDCRRYSRDPADRLIERVRAAAGEPLSDAMNRQDRRRRRSGKTRRARAAGRWGIGPSDLHSCRKWIEYRERPPEGYVPGPEDKTAAVLGTWLDEQWKRLQRVEYPWREVNVRIHVPGLDEPGEIDAYDPLLRRVIDLKSAGEWRWERVGEHGALVDDVKQTMTYGLGLIASGRPVETVELLYLRRASGQSERFVLDYDEGIALAATGYLQGVIDALDLGMPLPRDRQGPTLDGVCRRCPAVEHCWQVRAAEFAHRTPEGWLLARDRPDVEVALARYVEAHDRLARPGGAVKEEVKALVRGAETGRYGDYVYDLQGGRAKWVPDPEARAEQLAEAMLRARAAGGPPPDPDSLPVPERSVTSPVKQVIRRVRAAERADARSS